MGTTILALVAGVVAFAVPTFIKFHREGWEAVKLSWMGDAGWGLVVALIVWTGLFLFCLGRAASMPVTHRPHLIATAELRRFLNREWAGRVSATGATEFEDHRYSFIRARIFNDTLDATHESIARDLVAAVTFESPTATDLRDLEGRWCDPNWNGQYPRTQVESIVTIGVAQHREIDIAYIDQFGRSFALTRTTKEDPAPRGDRELGSGPYSVILRVRAPFVDQAWRIGFAKTRNNEFGDITCEPVDLASISSARV